MIITKETLQNLRKTQQKSHYGSKAKSMFIDEIFNHDNWNGGDGVVRQYFYDYVFENQLAEEIDFTYEELEFNGDIIVSHKLFNDQNYVTIILKGILDIGGYQSEIEDIAYFTWYKNRGTTENALCNGKLMTEEQYLFILNALQETGFEFNLQ